jgi:hypothetical protein
MKTIKRFIAPLVVLIAALPLSAQIPTGFSAQAGLSYGFDGLEKLTKDRKAGSLGVSYNNNIKDTKNAYRVNLLWNFFPGSFRAVRPGGIKAVETSIQSFQLSGDMFFYAPKKDLNLFIGLSLNAYYPTESSEEYTKFDGAKAGIRFGLDYRYNDKLSFDATFNLTEYGVLYVPGGGGLNPAWLQLSAHYRF